MHFGGRCTSARRACREIVQRSGAFISQTRFSGPLPLNAQRIKDPDVVSTAASTVINRIVPSPEDVSPHPRAEEEARRQRGYAEDIDHEEAEQQERQDLYEGTGTNWADAEERERLRQKHGIERKKTYLERPKRVLLPVEASANDYAKLLQITKPQVMNLLSQNGFLDEYNEESIPQELGQLLAEAVNIEEILLEKPFEDITPRRFDKEAYEKLPRRPPVLCVMGHVDHGKTTLIDWLRRANVAAGEAGGITQSIGAFPVDLPNGSTFDKLTMIDTPGHAAFSGMRERGAKTVDAVILVVSATDGVQLQTKESIGIIRKWQVPFIVAINKCDREEAQPERIREELLNVGVSDEEVEMVEISAKTGLGIEDLLITTELICETADPRTEDFGRAEIVVLEAKRSPKEGTVIHAMVQSGVLKPDDIAMVGEDYARVAHLSDYRGVFIDKAGPSMPVRFRASFKQLPQGGTKLICANHLDHAKKIAKHRRREAQKEQSREDLLRMSKEDKLNRKRTIGSKGGKKVSGIEDLLNKYEENGIDAISDSELLFTIKGLKVRDWYLRATPELAQARREAYQREARGQLEDENLIHVLCKADSQGALEALAEFAEQIRIPNEELKLNIQLLDLGKVDDQELNVFDQPRTVMLAFNVDAPKDPELANLKLLSSNIIFHLIEDLVKHLESLLKPDWVHHTGGVAVVQQVFKISKRTKNENIIAGCRVETGRISKSKHFRVERDGVEIHSQGALKDLKHHKEDRDEMLMGQECGIGMDFQLWKPEDRIFCIDWESIPRRIPLPEVGLRDDLQDALWQGADYNPPARPAVNGATLEPGAGKGDYHYATK